MEQRRLRLVFFYLLISLPLVVYGAIRTVSNNVNSPLNWVPASFPARARYDVFGEMFGPGDALIASWETCTLDDPSLDRLAESLRTSSDFFDDRGEWLLHHVVTGRELARQLTTGPAPVDWHTAIDRLKGSLVGKDGRTTCLVATFTPAGLKERERLVQQIQLEIAEKCGAATSQQHMAGPVIDGLSVDVASKAALERLALPSAIVVLVAACWCLRSVRMGMIVFGISVYAQAATLASVYYSGATMNALLIVLPPLIQVLAVAGGIHLANYYFDALPEHGISGAPQQMVRSGWLPCVLSFGTTAAGMASLTLSELTPIRSFGAFAAVGVLITLGLLFAVLPALLIWWPIEPPQRSCPAEQEADRESSGWSAPFAHFIQRVHVPVVGMALATMVVAGVGIRQLASSVRIETLFGPQSKIIRDYAWLEAHIGPLVPIEIDLTFAEGCPLSPEDRMTRLWQLNQAVRRVENIGPTFSALNLLPRFPSSDSLPADVYPHVLHDTLLAARPGFVAAGYLTMDGSVEHWRLTAYVNALGNVDYGSFLAKLQEQFRSNPANQTQPTIGISTSCTGIMPLVHEIQRQMLNDLFRSFLVAFAVIALIMTVAQGGFLAGLVSMIPNLFPTLLMFGALGWWRMPLDIGTVMTASIALGIAVDDTLHYLTFFHRGLSAGMPRREAVEWAYEHCGKAMLQTSVVCGLGLAVFAWNDFVPTQRFAWMMVALMMLALVGDLLLLPALLVSRLGKVCAEDNAESVGREPSVTARSRRVIRNGARISKKVSEGRSELARLR